MARRDEVIDNPVTGERFTFLETSADTNGELLRLELRLRPGGGIPSFHLHTKQEERFETLSGAVRVRLGRAWRELAAGESVVVPPGTGHVVTNESNEEVRVLVELRPALRTETLFETLCGLARDGKVSKRGLPNPLQVAVTARALGLEDYHPALPVGLQKAAFVLLAAAGRLLGYRATYPEYSAGER